jgi:hypothetical protein
VGSKEYISSIFRIEEYAKRLFGKAFSFLAGFLLHLLLVKEVVGYMPL